MGWLGKNFPAWSWSVLKISILCLQEAYLNNFCFTSPCQRLARPGCMQQLWCKHLLNMLYSPSPEEHLLHIKAHPLCLWRTRTCPGCSACRPRGTTASSEVAVLLQGWSAHKQFTDGIGCKVVSSAHPSHQSPSAMGISFFSKTSQAAKRAGQLSVSVWWPRGKA